MLIEVVKNDKKTLHNHTKVKVLYVAQKKSSHFVHFKQVLPNNMQLELLVQ